MLGVTCQLEPSAQAPAALERNIFNRLVGASTDAGSWLDSQTIEQGVKVCEMIGATLTYGLKFNSKALSSEDWRQAGSTGFAIARDGADAVIHASLKKVRFGGLFLPAARIQGFGQPLPPDRKIFDRTVIFGH